MSIKKNLGNRIREIREKKDAFRNIFDYVIILDNASKNSSTDIARYV